MDNLETQAHFALQKGERDSDRLVEDCFTQLANLLHGESIPINGRDCQIKVVAVDGARLMFDVRASAPMLDHIEFTINKTGWGMGLMHGVEGEECGQGN